MDACESVSDVKCVCHTLNGCELAGLHIVTVYICTILNFFSGMSLRVIVAASYVIFCC